MNKMKEINKERLKMKYLINVKTDSLVTKEDFLYEMFQAYEEKSWDITDNPKTQSQLWNAGLKTPITDMSFGKSFEALEEMGMIEITVKNGTTYYQIVNHPW